MTVPVRLLIADGRVLFQLGVAKALEKATNIKVVAMCSSGKDTVDKTVKLKPDVVLLDYNITEFDCFHVISQIRELRPETHVIIINERKVEYKNPLSILDFEPDGYVMEEINALTLINNINDVMSGERVISPTMGVKLLEAYRTLQKKDIALSQTNLTKREVEILSLVARGLTNREIANKLYISLNTVKAHLSYIMKKMNASNRQRAVLLALEKGIVTTADLDNH